MNMELYPAVYYISFLIFIKLKLTFTAEWKCTEDVCSEYLLANPCPNPSNDCKNSSLAIIIPSLSICNCCEFCITFQEEGGNCLIGYPGLPFPDTMCGPNLECYNATTTCIPMTHPSGFDPDFFPGYFCDEDNNCNCAVIVDDVVHKIFGEFKKTKDTDNEKQCECSIVAHKAKTQMNKQFPFGDTYMPTSRCLANGQYDPLQCMDNTCRCVDKETGEWDQNIPIVSPIFTLNVDNPSCFDLSIHKPGEYYKECELERKALSDEKLSAKEEGYNTIYSKKVTCNPDGSYEGVNA